MVEFVKQQVTPLGMCPSDEVDVMKRIEWCGRLAWKSEGKAGDDSYLTFYRMLLRKGHTSVFEHGNVVLFFRGLTANDFFAGRLDRWQYHPTHDVPNGVIVSGNVRAWIETEKPGLYVDAWGEGRPFAEEPYGMLFGDPIGGGKPISGESQLILYRNGMKDVPLFSFHIVTDRGISHEIVRHRKLGVTQESTRYVSYAKRPMRFILPDEWDDGVVEKWRRRANVLSAWYQADIVSGYKPQVARDVLPHVVATEMVLSGRYSDWMHFISLRDSPGAHPRIRDIAIAIRNFFADFDGEK